MAKLHRLHNLLRYGHPRRFRAALGLLTSTSREPWLNTIGVDFDEIKPGQALPWITFPSIDYLLERISPDMTVLEYGAGFSTIWWAERVAKVTSLERHATWAGKVQSKLDSLGYTNVSLRSRYTAKLLRPAGPRAFLSRNVPIFSPKPLVISFPETVS